MWRSVHYWRPSQYKDVVFTNRRVPILNSTVFSLTWEFHTWKRRSLYWDEAQVPTVSSCYSSQGWRSCPGSVAFIRKGLNTSPGIRVSTMHHNYYFSCKHFHVMIFKIKWLINRNAGGKWGAGNQIKFYHKGEAWSTRFPTLSAYCANLYLYNIHSFATQSLGLHDHWQIHSYISISISIYIYIYIYQKLFWNTLTASRARYRQQTDLVS